MSCGRLFPLAFTPTSPILSREMETGSMLKIPLLDGSAAIEFFPDELPEDYVDVIDVLRSEIAPLKYWRQCAVSYFHVS